MDKYKKPSKPVPASFVKFLANSGEETRDDISLVDMEFPTLDDMEMDVPYLGAYIEEDRSLPEDDSDLDMQYLIHVNPTLSVSSLSL